MPEMAPQILTPNVNFIPSSRSELFNPQHSSLAWGMEHLNNITEEMGYDGIEFHDVTVAVHAIQMRWARPEKAAELGRNIQSMHESWVHSSDPQPLNPALAREREKSKFVERAGAHLVFPTGRRSLKHLAKIEAKLGRDEPLPYVVYPDERGRVIEDMAVAERFPKASIQPTGDVLAAWGIDSPDGLVDQLNYRGLAVTWDHFHGDRHGKTTTRLMLQDKYLPTLLTAGLVQEIHLGLFRHDFAGVDPDRYQMSVQEGKALQNEGELAHTPLGELLDMLRVYNWPGKFVTIEMPRSGLEHIHGKLAATDVADMHRATTDYVRRLLPKPTTA